MVHEDTISAVITALGVGAVGIIRLSGPEALTIADKIFKAASKRPLADYSSHTMVYGRAVDAQGMDVDEVMCVYMQAPKSYTAEDVVEIQCHGGSQSLKQLLALTYYYGARPAEPGEFTKRAFLNGRIDLVQAEAVMDIINSGSQVALKLALRQQEGYLSKELQQIRTGLKDVIVHLEAVIDYPEEDIEDVTYTEVAEAIKKCHGMVAGLLKNAHTGRIIKEGLRTVIVGRPNVGKSSLLNTLLKEDRAIVSEYEGTTRDVIEEQLIVGGVPLLLADTAGIRQTKDVVEKIGVEKSKSLLDRAELAVVVLDGTRPLAAEDKEILASAMSTDYVIIVNKSDLGKSAITSQLKEEYGADRVVELSAKTKNGINSFVKWLEGYVYGAQGTLGEGAYVQNIRQIELLRQAKASLEEALEGCRGRLPYDCLTIDVHTALTLMGEITGDTVRDEIINDIFAKFCIGK